MKVELIVLLQLLASTLFEPFEIETPLIKKILKWLTLDLITLGLFYLIGHWTLLVICIPLALGSIYHFNWCKKNGIDPFKATPRKKYYEIRKWTWVE